MASRGEIKDAFYDRLTADATGTYDVTDADGAKIGSVTVETDDVQLLQVEEEETLPQVLWDDNYNTVVYNGCGSGPETRTYETDQDTVKEEIWREYVEAQFTVFVRAEDEIIKEPIYESVRDSFGRLGHGPWHPTELHADVLDVEVEDVSSLDTGDVEDVIRGDELQIFVTFYKDYPLDADSIDQVDQDVEGRGYLTT